MRDALLFVQTTLQRTLLHEALREVLGNHVAQKGSLVNQSRLRFDFSHPKGMSDEEIANVERMANAIVLQNEAVETRLMEVDEAKESGARALFGEKYGDEVRVVRMGTAIEGERALINHIQSNYVVELMLKRTGANRAD